MNNIYAALKVPNSVDDCFFYHTIELPGRGEIKGDWDLREVVSAYLGNVSFKNKRVLDVGTASGFLSFYMEKEGADVVSFDLEDGADWDIVPHYRIRDQLPQIKAAQSQTLKRLKNGYWLSHHALGSHAKVCYGNVYSIPDALGQFDVVVYGMIVGHLRDVFNGLYNGCRLCKETVVVTSIFSETETPSPHFAPRADRFENLQLKHWWGLNIGTMRAMLGVLGFEIIDIVKSYPKVNAEGFNQSAPECTAIVARRIGFSG